MRQYCIHNCSEQNPADNTGWIKNASLLMLATTLSTANRTTFILLHRKFETSGGSRKNIWGAWRLVILEATTAKRNYYGTN